MPRVIVVTCGSVTLKVRLYGDMTRERLARERSMAIHRAFQLTE